MKTFDAQVKAFLRSHKGHTQKALALVLTGMDHMLEHRDWDGLALLIKQTEGRMGAQIRAIVKNCIGGVSMAADKKHHTGMRFKLGDNFGPTEKLDALRDLVEAGETIFSDNVNALLGKEKAAPKAKTLAEVRKHVQEFAAKHGFELADLIEDPLSVEPTF